MKDRRTDIRYDFHQEIEYVLNYSSADTIFRGITIDISNNGLCLFVFMCLDVGQEITIRNIFHGSSKVGTVQWCNELGDNVYKVGLLLY